MQNSENYLLPGSLTVINKTQRGTFVSLSQIFVRELRFRGSNQCKWQVFKMMSMAQTVYQWDNYRKFNCPCDALRDVRIFTDKLLDKVKPPIPFTQRSKMIDAIIRAASDSMIKDGKQPRLSFAGHQFHTASCPETSIASADEEEVFYASGHQQQ